MLRSALWLLALAPFPLLADPAGPDAQAVCQLIHGEIAGKRARCCAGPPATDLSALCVAQLAPALAAGRLRIDAGKFSECKQATQALLASCDFIQAQLPPLPSVCADMVIGTGSEHQPCDSGLACADGLYCLGLSVGGRGQCAKPAPARTRCEVANDSLAGLLKMSEDSRHASCAGRCVRGECLPTQADGESCALDAHCGVGSRCHQGVCAPIDHVALGAACGPLSRCEFGASCVDGRCRYRKAAGESCTLPFECRSLACSIAPGEASGHCTEVCPAAVEPHQREQIN